ncbi:hypothetical protein CKM354_001188400 [Cercospora kikuchii]|uniref:Uncharacterized protein n=2 Tax=Cercospora kikuchii TaxID=84275 RepID=A0A9P3D0V0_9PEZI|nr:uncharacterized protein CKM354_001188400 [Cercospora kikuchii]GIZ48838.1 hypothetical protein CKM354_001188400 [Cercospora kikuchii]
MPAHSTKAATMAPIPQQNGAMHQHSLNTAAAELKYANSTHLVDVIGKDEDIRRLRFDIHILEDDNDELRELLGQEEARSDQFERLVNENLARAEAAEARLSDLKEELRMREQEVGTLRAEAKALETTAADSEAFLTEKLALTRELSVLRPQLEHLKTQASNTEALMTEKLELQRQLTELQCELENAKRDVKRAMAKRRNTGVEIAQEEQVEQLKRELAKEKRARQRAEEATEPSQSDVNVDEVRKELAREKRARQKAEEELEAAHENTQVEDVRKDLLKEKKAKNKLEEQLESLQEELTNEKKRSAKALKQAGATATATAENDEQLEELRAELAKEKKERAKAEKAAEKQLAEIEAQRTTLDEKLGQFRTKLRSTKEKLKETESELEAARERAASAATAPQVKKTTANNRKRNAAALDVDATTLGTPGDGPTAKRGRRAPAVGEKSSFSITPFLNRTASIAPESDHEEDSDDDAPNGKEIDVPIASPTALAATTKQKKLPLAQADSNVKVKKAAPRQRKQKAAAPMLDIVTEEPEDVHSQGQENDAASRPTAAKTIKTKTHDGDDPEKPTDAATKKKQKKRKSLVDFETFNKPEAAKKVQSKKNRKLGGLGKTLFDEEEEATAPAKALPGRMVLGGRGFGALGAGTKKAGGFLGASKIGSSILLTAQDGSGFQFSPLKRRRGNLDDTLRG